MTGRRRMPRRHYPVGRALLALVLIGAAAYSSGQTYYSGQVAQERADCQARVNGDVIDALRQRDSANKAITQAQRDLVQQRLDNGPGTTPKEADRRYLDALDQLERARAANPIETAARC